MKIPKVLSKIESLKSTWYNDKASLTTSRMVEMTDLIDLKPLTPEVPE